MAWRGMASSMMGVVASCLKVWLIMRGDRQALNDNTVGTCADERPPCRSPLFCCLHVKLRERGSYLSISLSVCLSISLSGFSLSFYLFIYLAINYLCQYLLSVYSFYQSVSVTIYQYV